jgi:hypothetical protein
MLNLLHLGFYICFFVLNYNLRSCSRSANYAKGVSGFAVKAKRFSVVIDVITRVFV